MIENFDSIKKILFVQFGINQEQIELKVELSGNRVTQRIHRTKSPGI